MHRKIITLSPRSQRAMELKVEAMRIEALIKAGIKPKEDNYGKRI